MNIDVTHSVLPWIADWAGFLRMRFVVGRDGKTANERLKVKSAKVQGISFAEGVFRGRRGEQRHRVAQEHGPEDDRAKQIGKKRFANDRGASMVQERR